MYNSQFNQDRWVDDILGHKNSGIFIDAGAARPVRKNNTYFFEKERGWRGILVEANYRFVNELKDVRKNPIIDRPLWDEHDVVVYFNTLSEHPTLATCIEDLDDEHKPKRDADAFCLYPMRTTTLSKIFEDNGWEVIDYLSLDVEGAEVKALQGLDVDLNRARCITVEHNKREEDREEIFNLLSSSGYVRLSDEERSWYFDEDNEEHHRWFWMEDWYVDEWI